MDLQNEIEKLSEAIRRLTDRVGGSAPEGLLSSVTRMLMAPVGEPSRPAAASEAPDIFGFADAKDRIEAGPVYSLLPPDGADPGKPPTSTAAPPAPGGVPSTTDDAATNPDDPKEPRPDESGRQSVVLEAINRGIWQLVSKSYTDGRAPGSRPPVPGGPPAGGGAGGLIQSVFDRTLGMTPVGRILGGLRKRVEPHVRRLAGRLGGGKTRTPKATAPKGRITTRPVAPRPGVKLPTAMPVGAPGAAGAAGAAGAGGAAGAAGGAGAAGAAGGGAAAVGGAAIPIAGAAIAVTMALVELAKVARQTAKEQENRARELAEVSAPHAIGVAQLDIERKMREIESGAATADTGTKLLESQDNFEDAIRPMQDLADNIKNILASGVLDVLTEGGKLLQPLLDVLNEIVKNIIGEAKFEAMANARERQREANSGFFADQVRGAADEEYRRQRAAGLVMGHAASLHDRYFGS